MACDSVRRLCVRWCGQLVGCSGSGRGELMSLRRTSPDAQELAGREGMKGASGLDLGGSFLRTGRSLVILGAESRPSMANCRTG